MDAISEQRLAQVNPILADKIHQLALLITSEPIRVTQGLRTWAQQNALYAQGRTVPGKIITDARGGYSWHNFGLAVDIVPLNQDTAQPDWNTSHSIWQQIISTGESLGLYSGSEFTHFKDMPHFQLTGKFPVSPDDEVRQIYLNEGMKALWEAAGLV